MPRRHSPAKHTPYTPKVPCVSKRRFANQQKAEAAISQSIDNDTSLKTYKCPYCTGWHLSSTTTK